MSYHLLPLPFVVVCVLFLGLPQGLRSQEDDVIIRDEDGNVRGGFGRIKRETIDNSDLVVEMKYPMKKNLEITGLSEEEKKNMLDMHNAYRSVVRPQAANMIELTWDDRIADFAQEWANECTATHRPNSDLDPWINMGEGLYWWFSGRYNEATAVKWWWDEVQYYTLSNGYCVPGEVCGHYITMVWAKSEKLGCGVARCERLDDYPEIERASYYFVCSYSGRFVSNIKPYIATDMACSGCQQTDYPKCRYNLCVTQDMINNDIGYDGSTALTGINRTQSFSHPKTEDNTGPDNTQTTQTSQTAASTQQPPINPTPSSTIAPDQSSTPSDSSRSQTPQASASVSPGGQTTVDPSAGLDALGTENRYSILLVSISLCLAILIIKLT